MTRRRRPPETAYAAEFEMRHDRVGQNNLTPADVHYGRGTNLLRMRRKIKPRTMNERRRLQRQNKVA